MWPTIDFDEPTIDEDPDRLDAESFVEFMLVKLASKGVTELPIGDRRVELALFRIAEKLKEARRHKNSRPKGVSEVLGQLAPRSTTYSLDGFWREIRNHQPGLVSIPNPTYAVLHINSSGSRAQRVDEFLPKEWRDLVEFAAEELRKSVK